MKKRIKNKITLPLTKKMILPVIAIAFMAVGYSTISTSFFLDGTLGIEQGLFDVRFTNVTVGGKDLTKDSVSEDGKKFTYLVTDNNRVTYEVTNLSKDYDVEVNVICSIAPETIVFKNNFNNKSILIARTSRNGNVSITLPEISSEVITLTCVLDITGLERTEPGSENIKAEKVDYLKVAETYSNSTTYFGNTLDRSKVESITLKDTKEVPEGVESWDVSNSGNESILAYTLDEDSDSMLELYIGQDGVVNVNPNSSNLFCNFTNISSINGLEDLDTSNVTDMSGMFNNCRNLTSIDVSHFDTSKVTTMYLMSQNCQYLASLEVSRWDTSKVTNMNRLFMSCYRISNLDVSHFDTSSVTDMTYMFSGCSQLKTIDISHFDTKKVTSMCAMFSNCRCTSLDVSNFITSSATDISSMFNRCAELTTIDVSHFDTKNVTNMSLMFYGCNKLKTIDVSHFDTSKVINMNSMFHSCSALTSLDLSSFNTSQVTTMSFMFYNCNSLTSLNISYFDTGNVRDMSQMFYKAEKLNTVITIKGIRCSRYEKMFGESAINSGAKITVNYTSDASDLVDKMIATKSSNSNVVKGTAVT